MISSRALELSPLDGQIGDGFVDYLSPVPEGAEYDKMNNRGQSGSAGYWACS